MGEVGTSCSMGVGVGGVCVWWLLFYGADGYACVGGFERGSGGVG